MLAQEDGLAIAGLVDEVMAALPSLKPARAYAVADAARRAATPHSPTFSTCCALALPQRCATWRAGRGDEEQSRLVALRPLDAWGDVWHALTRLQDETERFNLDKRQAVVAGLGMLGGMHDPHGHDGRSRANARIRNETRLRHHPDLLRERRAAYRPRLHLGRGRRDGALEAAGRVRRVLPDGNGRAWAEGGKRGAQCRDGPAIVYRQGVRGLSRHVAKDGVSYDQWIRTTEERHKLSCAELWRRIEANGNIYLGHYEGWYAVRDEAFYDEEELTARPDGSKVAPSGAPVEWVREPSYFFKLSKWQDRLLELYETSRTSSRRHAGGTR